MDLSRQRGSPRRRPRLVPAAEGLAEVRPGLSAARSGPQPRSRLFFPNPAGARRSPAPHLLPRPRRAARQDAAVLFFLGTEHRVGATSGTTPSPRAPGAASPTRPPPPASSPLPQRPHACVRLLTSPSGCTATTRMSATPPHNFSTVSLSPSPKRGR